MRQGYELLKQRPWVGTLVPQIFFRAEDACPETLLRVQNQEAAMIDHLQQYPF